jgi:hypothetical protein
VAVDRVALTNAERKLGSPRHRLDRERGIDDDERVVEIRSGVGAGFE